MAATLLFCFCVLHVHSASSQNRTVTVTGATGHTGSMVYTSLKQQGLTVRALVRNITKAREVLKCVRCDASEGIFVGDVSQVATLGAAMAGAHSLIITTGPAYHCLIPSIYAGCTYYPGADPKSIAWLGVKNQVASFASSTGPAPGDRHVVLLSNDLTTLPDNFIDKVGGGHGCFYALNGEAFTMASGLPYTIIKPNGLNFAAAATQEIVVAHDDTGWKPTDLNYEFIGRADVARLLTYAALNPDMARGLRFDVTSLKSGGTPTHDVSAVFCAALNPWDPRACATLTQEH